MMHKDNIKTYKTLSKHLEMEDKRQKSLPSSSLALLPRVVNLKAKGLFIVNRLRNVHKHLKTPDLRFVLPRSKRLRAIKRKIYHM